MSYLEEKFSFEEDGLVSTAQGAVDYIKQSRSDLPRSLSAKNLLCDLKESVCLLQQDGLETAFVHRSFQEYFAAVFATSLHGEKVKKVIDRYALRFGDSVVMMAMDINREVIEQEWVLPTIDFLNENLDLNDGQSSSSVRMNKCFAGLRWHIVQDDILPAFSAVNAEIVGRLETLCALYARNLGAGFFVRPLRVNANTLKEKITSNDNKGKYGFPEFLELFGDEQVDGFGNKLKWRMLDFSKDNDWWMDIFGVDKMFSDLSRSLKAIKRDIVSRDVRRRNILNEFL